MTYDLTILIPGIRTDLWMKVYKSAQLACTKKSWEIVFVGPYPPPETMSMFNNVQFINSFSSPIACRQMGLLNARGDWICYAADDVEFCPGAFDVAFSIINENQNNPRTVVVGKYLEGISETNLDNPLMRDNPYWSLYYHTGLHSVLRPFMRDYYLVNTGLVSRKLLTDIGGWDCQFEACAMACVDLSIRLQNEGAQCLLQNEPIFKSTHLSGHAGDHGPIHDAQTLHDEPLFFDMWHKKENENRGVIDINSWKQCPARWERRFGKV